MRESKNPNGKASQYYTLGKRIQCGHRLGEFISQLQRCVHYVRCVQQALCVETQKFGKWSVEIGGKLRTTNVSHEFI
jgi:hypothetical protein